MEKLILERTALGIEFGSTRIKAVLIDERHMPVASGDYTWENRYENGIWTYPQEEILAGLQAAYRAMAADVKSRYGQELTTVGCIGVSAMMHGYLAFDDQNRLLVPFRTWRNTITEEAAALLTDAFQFNIPQRWSIAHLYQAVLNGEEHLDRLHWFTTLAGYAHFLLTGEKVLGIGDASGMFPIDSGRKDYDPNMLDIFDALMEPGTSAEGSKAARPQKKYPWKLRELLPKVLLAGDPAGPLTETGAKLLDPTGTLQPGVLCCPPEGDAGTGMTATNSVARRTGNVSAGTSIFAMVVLEKPLQKVHQEIDMVTTPSGDAVAMVHCNNCTSDLNAWVNLLEEAGQLYAGIACGDGQKPVQDKGTLFTKLFERSLAGDPDCGGILPVNYYSGESVTHLNAGLPLLLRAPGNTFHLANLMRAHIYSAMATLAIGLNILKEEQVAVDTLYGHGGLFKTPGVAQRYLAAAAQAKVSCMETAGEGGPYGMAVLGAYTRYCQQQAKGPMPLQQYLQKLVFAEAQVVSMDPEPADIEGFRTFLQQYQKALAAEIAAIERFF